MSRSSIPESRQPGLNDHGAHDRWFILSLLFLNYFALYTHRYVLNYIQPPIQDEFGLSDIEMSWFAWAFQFTYAFASLFVGYLGDRFRRRSVLIVSLSLSTLALAGMGLAQSYWDMLILRIFLGATQAACVPSIAGIMADCFTQRNRSRAVSIYLLSSPFSTVVAGWAGGGIADRLGWRASMFAFGGLGLLVVISLIVGLREPERTERSESKLGQAGGSLRQTVWAVLCVPSFLLLVFAYVLSSNALQQLNFFLPVHLAEHHGMNLEEAGVTSTLTAQVGTVLALLTGGALGDLLARRWVSGRFCVQVYGLLLALPTFFVLATTESLVAIGFALFVNGVGFWIYLSNLWTTTFEVVDPAARSTAVGLLNVAAGLLGSWGYPLIGGLRDSGAITDLRTVFFAFGIVLAASVALLVVIVFVTLRRDLRATQTSSS